jgi:hypothetical protein
MFLLEPVHHVQDCIGSEINGLMFVSIINELRVLRGKCSGLKHWCEQDGARALQIPPDSGQTVEVKGSIVPELHHSAQPLLKTKPSNQDANLVTMDETDQAHSNVKKLTGLMSH